MSWVKGLGYLGVRAADVGAWRQFAIDGIGIQAAEFPDDRAGADGRLRLRIDERAWRLEVLPHPTPGVAYVGWEIADDRSLDDLAGVLASHGTSVSEGTAADAEQRRVAALLRCTDPDGTALEFFTGPQLAGSPFRSPRGARFVTGDGGMGHLFAVVADLDRSVAFYEDLLGFRLSDTITLRTAPQPARFYHVNPRHHSLALAALPGVEPAIDHLMLEVDEPQTVIDVLDTMVATGAPVQATLGRHPNDRMFSFYVRTPSAFDLEFGCSGRRIEDEATWTVGAYTKTSVWGHDRWVPRDDAKPDDIGTD